ncbi:MAG: glycosyltransferase family 39 protein [Anaerolineae bacterium]|nr:glycosyltransferase family 39 protein [Anaerolineae bacterium]
MQIKFLSDPYRRNWLARIAGGVQKTRCGKRDYGPTLALLAIILLFFAQLVCGAKQLSLTSDEPTHYIHGYTFLTTGDTWIVPQHRHPPLPNIWVALPLLLQPERPDVYTTVNRGGEFSAYVRELWPQFGPIERVAFVTRYPNMLLGILLLACVTRWTRERFGASGALIAAVAMALDPTMIAHAQLTNTDISIALTTFACFYAVYAFNPEVPQTKRWIQLTLIGLLLGATLAAKGSGIMTLPFVIGILGWKIGQPAGLPIAGPTACPPTTNHKLRNTFHASRITFYVLRFTSYVLLITFLFLWASYGFQLESLPGTSLRLPLVAHGQMVWGILTEAGRSAFLMGEQRQGGWWWYFPFAFAIKTPIPLILASLASLILTLHDFRRKPPILSLWLFPLIYTAIAIRSGMNIGYRHMLPVLPFLYVGLGRIGELRISELRITNGEWRMANGVTRIAYHGQSQVALRFTFYVLFLWLLTGALRIYPFAIAYFNEFAGGPENGYHYLVDSNCDWGQSFIALKRYMEKNAIPQVALSYYTWIDPAIYGINYRPLPPAPEVEPTLARRFDPEPGIYAISATPLQGVMIADKDTYSWFRHQSPIAQPGYGLLIYNVQPRARAPQWIAQCNVPAIPLTPEAIIAGFGRDDLREIAFDCTQSWIYPGGGLASPALPAPGWYALHRDIAEDSLPTHWLKTAHLSYEQRTAAHLPPFKLYEQNTVLPTPDQPNEIPMGALTHLGTTIETGTNHIPQPGDTIYIETWWRVESIPGRPLSLMLHLAGPGNQPVIVGDGLGIPREAWTVGDIIVQRHTLAVPPDAPPGDYVPHIGVYWLDTLERWTNLQTRQDTIINIPIEIK